MGTRQSFYQALLDFFNGDDRISKLSRNLTKVEHDYIKDHVNKYSF